jgi:hypothetical protein
VAARDTYRRTLIEACYIAGDEMAFAERINCPLPDVLDWLIAKRSVPVAVFLKSVDIILARNARQIRDTEVFLDEVRRRTTLRKPRERHIN